MTVPATYFAVVLIWSTTPLGIVWSSESISPTLAVLMRMLIALCISWWLIILMKVSFPRNKSALLVYSYSGLGLFLGMLLGYMATQYISSGMMSLIFGFAPIFSGFIAQKILPEPRLNKSKLLALIISLCGLAVICSDSLSINEKSWIGITLVLLATLFFSLSAVLVKSVEFNANPIITTTGALTFATPLFFLSWVIMDGTLPVSQWQEKSLWSILYLAVFGSLIGFVGYYYILQKLATSTVALITLITPVFALALGAWLNNEAISNNLIIGTLFIVCGLSIYQLSGKNMNLNKNKMQCTES